MLGWGVWSCLPCFVELLRKCRNWWK